MLEAGVWACPVGKKRIRRWSTAACDAGHHGRACSIGHIRPRANAGPETYPGRYVLEGARGIVRVAAIGHIAQVPVGVGLERRGRVGQWSRRSRFRLMVAAAEALWPQGGYLLLTLTYPASYSGSWVAWKRDLATLRKRWERVYGPMGGIWVMEFQRRGAPHFHLVIQAPRARLPWLRRWVSLSWYAVVGSGDPKHLAAGTNIKEADARGASRYLMTELGKRLQKQLPPDLEDRGAGRWWGIWRLKRERHQVRMTRAEFHRVRSVLWRLAAVQGYSAANTGCFSGLRCFGDDNVPWGLFAQVLAILGEIRGPTKLPGV